MSKAFIPESIIPLHLIRTNDPRFKHGGGHAVEISKPEPDDTGTRTARFRLKTTVGQQQIYLDQDAVARVFRTAGAADAPANLDEKYRVNWRRLPIVLAGILLVALLTLQAGSLVALGGLLPVTLLGFSPHVRTVVELLDTAEDGTSNAFLICYLPKSAFYRLYELGIFPIT